MLKLYQFPVSHYCEKVRWALALKQIDYDIKNLLPGLHTLTTQKLSSLTSVPILTHNNIAIQGSSEIISYLDKFFPAQNLTPEDENVRNNALEWEQYIDEEIGVNIRLCFYHILLEYPDIVIPFFTHNGPWYGKPLFAVIFSKLKLNMQQSMKLNDISAKKARKSLKIAIDKLESHYQKHEFLAGNQFSRADLAAAYLLAPLHMPKQFGLPWPEKLPEKMEELIAEFSGQTNWVTDFYDKYR